MCSFCGKANTDLNVTELLAGPLIPGTVIQAFICNECVCLCAEVLKDRAESRQQKETK